MLSKALPALIYFVRVMKLGKRINLLIHKFDQTEGPNHGPDLVNCGPGLKRNE